MFEVYAITTTWQKTLVFSGPLKAAQEKYRQIIRGGNLATITKAK